MNVIDFNGNSKLGFVSEASTDGDYVLVDFSDIVIHATIFKVHEYDTKLEEKKNWLTVIYT